MSSCLFTGCSFTEGIGLEFIKNDPGLWCNILHLTHPDLKGLDIINLGKGGSNNEEIFYTTAEELLSTKPKYAFVCWTESHRMKINPGIETYPTELRLTLNDDNITDININGITYSKTYLNNIKNRFMDLQNSHYKFLDILNYCRLLLKIAVACNTKIYFVNGICNWDDQYFDHNNSIDRNPNVLTLLTQQLLHVTNRDDDEIFVIYDRMHKEYKETQGLTNWINLYNGFRSKYYLDLGNDNLHPGYKSNYEFAKFLLTQF